jgi:hypothetical protein
MQLTEWPPFFSHPITPSLGQPKLFFALHTARGAKVIAEAVHARIKTEKCSIIILKEEVLRGS